MKNLSTYKKIQVTVNNREIDVYNNLTILQSLLQENIHIPHLCYDIRLDRSNGNCGLCVVELGDKDKTEVKACQTPIKAGMNIITSSPRLESYRKIRLEQLLSDHNADCVASCVQTCPANIDIQSYLYHVGNGNFEAAIRVIKERNPFPVACGRVCPHPCEAQCRRSLVDEPVAINYIKRFAADWDMKREYSWQPEKKPSTGQRIAIVGAGPSGLTAAYYSAINGHDVTVFERQPDPGGMMRYGIPEYRLPKKLLDEEISLISKLGVRLVTGKSLGTHLRLEDLAHDFDSVYLAIGSWRATPMSIEGEQNEGVWLGVQYLEKIAHGESIELGDVVVVGGGNTAFDCARTALRNGAKSVKIVYRRTREELPAEQYEVNEAIHENVEMLYLMAPTKITRSVSDRNILECIRMELGKPDRSGRRRPVPIENSQVLIEADTIIGAIGQSTNTQFLYNDLPVKLNKWGDIEINGNSMQTSEDNIFAGGDCVTGPATVIQAVAAGRRAAEAINNYLQMGYIKHTVVDYSCSRGSMEDLPKWEFEVRPVLSRASMPVISDQERVNSFVEVETGIDEKSAKREARRCLKCGCAERYTCDLRNEATAHEIEYREPMHEKSFIPIADDHPFIVRDHNKCISCGRCIAVCSEIEGPDILAFYIRQGRQLVGTKSGLPLEKTDCVSCGQCVNACPCGALDYKRERNKVFRAINSNKKTVVAFVAPAVRSVISDHYAIGFENAASFTAGMLKKLGFDRVFDFTFAADLTIVEETTEFMSRINEKGVMPQFTSCCPGWVNFVERRYPELIPHLSTCKSPQQMMGTTVKNHFARLAGIDRSNLFVVSVVPCLAKKYEAVRPEFVVDDNRDIDAVITTTELIEMKQLAGLNVRDIELADFDEPYKRVTGAGILFGASGGVAEAALRMATEIITGEVLTDHLDFEEIRGFTGVKEATVKIKEDQVRVAVISGLHNAESLIHQIISGQEVGYDLIEVMACPGGCICGAGHPVPEKVDALEQRQKVLVNIDKHSEVRKSHENPDVLRLYNDFYQTANSELAHELLHTSYNDLSGNVASSQIFKKADSTYITHEIIVCQCESCQGQDSKEIFARLAGEISRNKMSPFIDVRSIRLKGNHPSSDVYITFDGKLTDNESIDKIIQRIKKTKKS